MIIEQPTNLDGNVLYGSPTQMMDRSPSNKTSAREIMPQLSLNRISHNNFSMKQIKGSMPKLQLEMS